MTTSIILLKSLLLISFLLLTTSIHTSFNEISSETFAKWVATDFGLSRNGIIQLSYNIQPKDYNSPYESYAILLIITKKEKDGWYSAVDTGVTGSLATTYCNLPSFKRILADGEGYLNITIDETMQNDQYSLLAVQCRDGYSNNLVQFEVTLDMKNPKPYSSEYSHLGIQEVSIMNFLGGEIIVYALLLLGSLGQIYVAGQYTLRIHWLFFVTLVFSLIYQILLFVDYKYYNIHGEEPTGLTIAVNVLGVFRDTTGLMSLLLLSLGWTLLRNHMSDKEMNIVSYSITSFFIFSLGSAFCLNGNDQACQGLSMIAFVIKSLILLAIIIAMNFTVTQLRAMLNHSPWVPSIPLQYARCKQFQVFRWIFILYLLLPTAFLIIQVTSFSWRESWVIDAMNEMLTFLFIFHIGVTFSPLHEPSLTRAFDGSMNAAHIE